VPTISMLVLLFFLTMWGLTAFDGSSSPTSLSAFGRWPKMRAAMAPVRVKPFWSRTCADSSACSIEECAQSRLMQRAYVP
jgi:hypothetical protein